MNETDEEPNEDALTCDSCGLVVELNDGCLVCTRKSEKNAIVYVKKNQDACDEIELQDAEDEDG